MDIQTDITVLRQQRRPRVHTQPHPHRSLLGKHSLNLSGSPQRLRSRRKDDERPVALLVHNPAATRGRPLLNHSPLRSKRLRPSRLTQLAHQTRRPLHVREQKRHRSRRQLRIHAPRIADKPTRRTAPPPLSQLPARHRPEPPFFLSLVWPFLDQPPSPDQTTSRGAFLEQSGRKQWQPVANAPSAQTAELLAIFCHRLHPLAVDAAW